MGHHYTALSRRAQQARLRAHLQSIVWFTYRCGFPPVRYDMSHTEAARDKRKELTSDAGWGCMIRTGQMLLAETFRRHWNVPHDANDELTRYRLLKLFADEPTAPFSLHAIVQRGEAAYGARIGSWYGPTIISRVLCDLVTTHGRGHDEESDADVPSSKLGVLVAHEGMIYVSEVEACCCPRASRADSFLGCKDEFDPIHHPPPAREPEPWKCALLLLVPLRLGLDSVSEEYIRLLSSTFQFPQSVGLMGGKRAHAVYVVGTNERDAFVFDPHTIQPAARSLPEDVPIALRSLCTDKLLVMTLAEVDPSLALGFFCRDRSEFEDLRERIENLGESPVMVADAPPDMSDGMLACVASDVDDGVESGDEEDEYIVIRHRAPPTT